MPYFITGYIYYKGQVLDQHGIWQRRRGSDKPTKYTPMLPAGGSLGDPNIGFDGNEDFASWVARHPDNTWIGRQSGPNWPHICEYQGK